MPQGRVVARQLPSLGAAALRQPLRAVAPKGMFSLIQLLARFIANGLGGGQGAACGCPLQSQLARELSEELPQEPGDQ
jgi:hypothetical protein